MLNICMLCVALGKFDYEALKQYGRNHGKKLEAIPSLINDDKITWEI